MSRMLKLLSVVTELSSSIRSILRYDSSGRKDFVRSTVMDNLNVYNFMSMMK